MQKTTVRYIAGFTGSLLILVGLFGTFQRMIAPHPLSAESNPKAAAPQSDPAPTSSLAAEAPKKEAAPPFPSVNVPFAPEAPSALPLKKEESLKTPEMPKVNPAPAELNPVPPVPNHPAFHSVPAKADHSNAPGADVRPLPSRESLPTAPKSPAVNQAIPLGSPQSAPLPGLTPLVKEPAPLALPSQKTESLRQNPNPASQVKMDQKYRRSSNRGNTVAGTGLPGTTDLEGEQKANVILKKIVPEEVQVGQKSLFRILVKNIGEKRARNVVLREEIPAKTFFESADPVVSPTPQGELIWKDFDLAPNEERTFAYTAVPQEEGELGSIASISFSTDVSGKTVCTRPNLQVDVKAPKSIVIGEELPLEILISNTGTGAANDLMLTEKVPAGLTHPGGSVLENKIERIAPGEAKKLTLTLKSTAPGTAANILLLSDGKGYSKEVKTEIRVNAPELLLQITGSKQRYLDRESTYTLKITNPGSAAAKNVSLTATLPDNVQFIRTNNLGEYDKAAHTVRWELVELPENIAPGEIELVVLPARIGSGRLLLQGEGENGLSAEVSQEISVDGLAALSYTVKSLSDPVEVGKEAEYEICISNKGTKNSTNINLQVLVPDEMKVSGSEGPTKYQIRNGALLFDNIGSLGAKQDVVYKLKAICSVPGDHRIKVQVSSDDFERLVKEESVRAYR
ncbi:MAG: hypothetical protein Q4G69_04845 [Planctomycetia bacterium]|nr:hypothetical protein [Planctomycetia bacterium]